jgi:hypothetical protein
VNGNPGTPGAAGGVGAAGSASGSGISGSFTTGPTDTLAFTTEPAGAKAGKTLAPVVVEIQAAGNALQTSDTSAVTLAIESGPSGATLLGTLTVNAVGGVATFNDLSIDTAGTFTLTASDDTDNVSAGTDNSTSFTITPKAINKLIFIQPPTNVTAGVAISPAITVQISDKFGNAVTGNTSVVTLFISTGPAGGVLSGTFSKAAVNGVATFPDVILDKSGAYTLIAGDGTFTAAPAPSFTVAPAAASKLRFSTQPPATTVAGATLAPFVVKEKDAFGNKVPDSSSGVTLSIASGPSNASLGGTFTAMFSNGLATFGGLVLFNAGPYTLTATDGSLTGTSASFAVISAAPANLAFIQPPSNVKAGHAITPAITVFVTDEFANPVSGMRITLAIASGPSGATIGGTPTVVAHKGVATFDDVSFTTAGSYTLQATHGSVMSQPSASFTVKHVAATQLAFVQQPTATTSGTAITPPVEVDVEDSFGNLVTNNDSDVTLAIQRGPAGAVLSGTFMVAASGGEAMFSDLLLDTPGTYKFVAGDGALAKAKSAKFTVSASS